MSNLPDTLVLKRHRDLEGIGRSGIWVRRGVVAALAALAVIAVLNVLGQRPTTASADVPAAKLSLYAPTVIRGGDFMEARFHVTAKHELRDARLLLDPGWAEGMSMNTVEPSPLGQASSNGRLSFDLGHIPAGKSFILFMQFQVNPTNLAWHRPQDVELLDGNRVLAHIHHSITVLP